jgi:hypothetical protein
MPQDGDERPCPHKDENGKPCNGKQTFKRNAKPLGWYTFNPPNVQAGWKCEKNPEHFDNM